MSAVSVYSDKSSNCKCSFVTVSLREYFIEFSLPLLQEKVRVKKNNMMGVLNFISSLEAV